MYVDDFIWLFDIVEKLLVKHHVTQDEVESIFFNRPRYRFVESGYTPGDQQVGKLMQDDTWSCFSSIRWTIWPLF